MWQRITTVLILIWLPGSVVADVVLAARTLRSNSIIAASDLYLQKTDTQGVKLGISDIVGLETRVTIYQGRPISLSDIGPATIIERNQIVTLIYASGSLLISAEGRSLGRAGIGDRLKVMNLSSRHTVLGTVNEDGTVGVGNTFSRTQN